MNLLIRLSCSNITSVNDSSSKSLIVLNLHEHFKNWELSRTGTDRSGPIGPVGPVSYYKFLDRIAITPGPDLYMYSRNVMDVINVGLDLKCFVAVAK